MPFCFLQVKLFRKPREHAERIFNILVFHIKDHYDNGYKTVIASQIRLAVSAICICCIVCRSKTEVEI